MNSDKPTCDIFIPGAISETEERFQLIEAQIRLLVLNQKILKDMIVLLKTELTKINLAE